MSGYIGNIPTPQATQSYETFTATGGQTTFNTIGYTPGFLQVFLNGVLLVDGTDYTASNGSDVVLATGAISGDILTVISFSTFEVNSQTFTGTTTFTGDVNFGDNDKAIFGAGSDLQIYHDGSHARLREITGEFRIQTTSGGVNALVAKQNAEVEITYAGATKLATTNTGIDVTGTVVTDGLTVDGTGVVGTFSSSNNNTVLRVKGNGATNGGAIGSTSADDLVLLSGLTEKMRIDSSGNVGIGTTSPESGFHLFDGTNVGAPQNANRKATLTIEAGSEGSADIQFLNASYNHIFFGDAADANVGILLYDHTNNSMRFHTNAAERMRIDSSGNLLIGQTDSNARLASTSTTNKQLSLRYTGVASYYTSVDSSGNYIIDKDGAERMRIDSSGNLLVGTTSALGYGLHEIRGSISSGGVAALAVYNADGSTASTALNAVKNSSDTTSSQRFVQFYAAAGSTPMGGIVGNGASNVQFASISDVREKTNIQSISGSLNKIIALNPVEFDWIASGEHVGAGFVAQEVEQIFPEFVIENMANDGQEERKGLTGGMTGGIIAHLVKAIQEQQAIIEDLEARVATLEAPQ